MKIHKKNDHNQKEKMMEGKTTSIVIEHNLNMIASQKKKLSQEKYWKERDYDEQQTNMIHSIKSSINRNLSGFPLCPGLNNKQRHQVMEKIRDACEKLEFLNKDLKGTFVELKNLTDEQKEKLGDHVFSITD